MEDSPEACSELVVQLFSHRVTVNYWLRFVMFWNLYMGQLLKNCWQIYANQSRGPSKFFLDLDFSLNDYGASTLEIAIVIKVDLSTSTNTFDLLYQWLWSFNSNSYCARTLFFNHLCPSNYVNLSGEELSWQYWWCYLEPFHWYFHSYSFHPWNHEFFRLLYKTIKNWWSSQTFNARIIFANLLLPKAIPF